MKESIGNGKLLVGLVMLAAQVGTKVGLSPVRSDAELGAMAVRRADHYDIELKPEHLLAFSFTLHFKPTNRR